MSENEEFILGIVLNKSLYSVLSNTDLDEGRGKQFVLGWFTDFSIATEVAAGQYVMGTNCPIEQQTVQVFVQDGTGRMFLLGQEVVIENPRLVRERALKKLTPEERAILGV